MYLLSASLFEEKILPVIKIKMSNKNSILIAIVLITILGLGVYANSLSGKFIWDDYNLIPDNKYINNLPETSKFFAKNIAVENIRKYYLFRPLQMLTYTLDYQFWKLDVRGYHLTNIFLHILVALNIFWLVNILFHDKLLSLFTGILFVVHPIHTEAVAYISGRSDSLALLFILLCFISYIKYHKEENIATYILVLLTYCFALLSRETSLTLPLLLLSYHYSFKQDTKLKVFLPIVGITLFYILLRLTMFRDLLTEHPTSLLQRMPGFFVAFIHYLGLLFSPSNLHMEYGQRIFLFTEPKAVLGGCILILLLICALRKRKSSSLISFSILWFLLALLPVSNLYPLNAYMSEHWLYTPSIGFFLILAWMACYICRSKDFKILAGVFMLLLVGFYSYLTIKQNHYYWQEPILFYKRTLEYNPDSSRIYNNLAVAYERMGIYEPAIDLLKKAIELDPAYAITYNNLGFAYCGLGKPEQAIPLFKKSIELDPTCQMAYSNLIALYFHQKQYKLAIEYCDRARQIGFEEPSFSELLNPYR